MSHLPAESGQQNKMRISLRKEITWVQSRQPRASSVDLQGEVFGTVVATITRQTVPMGQTPGWVCRTMDDVAEVYPDLETARTAAYGQLHAMCARIFNVEGE